MTTDFREKIKSNNLQEQIRTSQAMLAEISEGIAACLEKNAKLAAERTALASDVTGLKAERDGLLKEVAAIRVAADNTRKDIHEKEQSHIAFINEANDALDLRVRGIVDEEKKAGVSLNDRLSTISDLEKDIARLTSMKSELTDTTAKLNDDTRKHSETLQKVVDLIEEQRKIFVEEQSRHAAHMGSKQKELERFEAEIVRKIAEAKEPLEQIAAENKKLDIRKRDIEIYESRIHTKMRQMFP